MCINIGKFQKHIIEWGRSKLSKDRWIYTHRHIHIYICIVYDTIYINLKAQKAIQYGL